MTGLRPDGRGDGRGHRRRAAAGPDRRDGRVDYINAHGSGTKQNDRHETAAFKRASAQHAYRVPVSSIKSMVGHSLGAIGSIEIAACALAIEHDVVPPTANCDHPRPGVRPGLRARTTARELPVDVVLSVGSGFGGFQSAMVFARRRRRPRCTQPDAGAVVTGIGVVAPNGIGTDAHWGRHSAGTQRHRADHPLRRQRLRRRGSAGEVAGFDAAEYIDGRLHRADRPVDLVRARRDRRWRSADAGFDPRRARPVRDGRDHRQLAPGGNEFGQREIQQLWGQGRPARRRLPVDRLVLRRQHRPDLHPPRVQGALRVLVAEGAGGLDSLAHAAGASARGHAMAVVGGGTEAPLEPVRAGLPARQRPAQRRTDPARRLPAVRPARQRLRPRRGRRDPRGGGAGARRAGAAPGSTARSPATAPPTTAASRRRAARTAALARAIRIALDDAAVAPGEIDVVFADGAGTRRRRGGGERAALSLGEPHAVPVTVPKTMVGRLRRAASLDAAAALLSMRDGHIRRRSTSSAPDAGHGLALVRDQHRDGRRPHRARRRPRLWRLQQRPGAAPRHMTRPPIPRRPMSTAAVHPRRPQADPRRPHRPRRGRHPGRPATPRSPTSASTRWRSSRSSSPSSSSTASHPDEDAGATTTFGRGDRLRQRAPERDGGGLTCRVTPTTRLSSTPRSSRLGRP